jgi:pilus assembly protein CpaB
MRRGGLLILLIGLILIVGGVAFYLLVLVPGSGGGGEPAVDVLPTEPPQVDIVRARVDIPANTVLLDAQSLLEVVQVPQNEVVNLNQTFSRISDIEGQLTLNTIRRGDDILSSQLTDPGLSQQMPTAEPERPRDKAYPFIVNNLSGVADQIKPGDFVDVVATFSIQRRQSYPLAPSSPGQDGAADPEQAADQATLRELLDLQLNSTKTIVQRAQVLRVVRPPVVGEGTPDDAAVAPESGSLPQVDESGQPIDPATGGTSSLTQGAWTLILALNDQEVELMEFALSTNSRMVLVLRGAGDTDFEPTIGATFDLLISEFGVPLPRPIPPRVYSEDEVFVPEPTLTPAPTRVP